MLSRSWRRRITHFSDEDLLIYLDGEAASKTANGIERHLQSCWGCRARLHQIEQAVTGFVTLRATLLDSPGAAPPKGWREFEFRLDELARRSERPPLSRRLSASIEALLRFPKALKLGAAFVALAVVCLWLAVPASTVSAKEVLARSGDAEARIVSRVSSPVVYQKVRLRRTAARAALEEATLEVWTDIERQRVGHRGEDRLWRELDKVLEANRLASQPLVSARTFSSWRSAVRVKDESVERTNLPSGAPALLLRTTASGPYGENQIVEGEFQVRAADWSPQNQVWRVQGQDRVWQYELQAVEQLVLARNLVETAVLGDLPASAAPPVRLLPPPSLPAGPTPSVPFLAADPEIVEIETRYALHRRGDCLNGLLQVRRDSSGKIVVRGLAETQRQKEELLAALPRSPLLVLEIKALDELEESAETPARPAEQVGKAPATVQDHEIPVAELLRPRLAERYGADNASQRLAALANEAVSLSRTMRMESWALRRLVERYGSATETPLARSASWMLETMMREHLLRLRSESARGFALLEPLWPAGGGGGSVRRSELSTSSWRECLELAEFVEQIDTLIDELFAAGHPTASVATRVQKLQAAFAGLDADLRKVEARLALSTVGERP